MPASFLGLNDGSPIYPMSGGLVALAQTPLMRAAAPEVTPAGYGPIERGIFPQLLAMTMPPPINWPGVCLQDIRQGRLTCTK